MGRLEIQPSELITAQTRQGTLAEEIRGLRGHLDGAAGGAGAAGDADATGAVEEFSRGWASNLGALDQALDGMAGNLGAAAGAYQKTDSGAMPGAGG
ncbi:MAG: hypothetical protein H0U32_03565 [Thermoleophilaceae bacterium]|nr:hypothetical protein [Thermoleophilaceae bacterium]